MCSLTQTAFVLKNAQVLTDTLIYFEIGCENELELWWSLFGRKFVLLAAR